jgi:glyoxylase-like metal-dependent hydrolase (beta-lactamase superfamily II)
MKQLSPDLYCYIDTCRVYVVKHGKEAVLIDFGAGDVLDALPGIGVEQVTDVLITHHHRPQTQGLARARDAGAAIWVPHTEQDLIANVDEHWQAREIYNNYNMRLDRFSLLEPVPIAGTLHDYERRDFGGRVFEIIPTPGHTTGSITIAAEVDGRRVAFVGDLLAAPGKLWSLAGAAWSYNGAEGLPATVLSLLDLQRRELDVLLPSHGDPITAVAPAVDLTVERLSELMRYRGQNPRLFDFLRQPYLIISPHLLRNRTSLANSYVLLSESRKALLIDFGYDFVTGFAAGNDRASRRPWLYTLPGLKADFGVAKIDVVIPTHFHDDHVAGMPLLHDVEGTQTWVAENFADVLLRPNRYNLPCLWYDPIPVDRRLRLETPIRWEEYELTLYALPGHTKYAVAICVEVDGQRVLATGDQYQGAAGVQFNYVYQSHFDPHDYVTSAELYRRLDPDLILPGHWEPLKVTPEYLDQLEERGAALERLHRELLLEEPDLSRDDLLVRLYPYQAEAHGDEPVELTAEVRNPFHRRAEGQLALIAPAGWSVAAAEAGARNRCSEPLLARAGPAVAHFSAPGRGQATVRFCVRPPRGVRVRRARVAVDLTIGGQRFGQQAEALVTVR